MELRILDGGQNYNPEYLRVHIVGNGFGFEANSTGATVSDGVIESIDIVHPGSGYEVGQSYTVEVSEGTGGTGSGFSAFIDGGDVKNGVIMIDLLNGGYGYTSEPTVILRGGKLDNYDYPYSFVQGSRVGQLLIRHHFHRNEPP